MSYESLAWLHLITILPAVLLGAWLLARRKGTPSHKLLGKLFMALMLATALITLFMPAQIGPRLAGHFGFIHLFSIMVLYFIPSAYLAVRNGNLRRHRLSLITVLPAACSLPAPWRCCRGACCMTGRCAEPC